MNKPIKVTVEGYEVKTKSVFSQGNTTAIFVPKRWAGKKVVVVLIEEAEEEIKSREE